MGLAREQGFAQALATSLVHWGRALAAQGRGDVGIPQIHQGLAASRATGAEHLRPCHLAYLTEAYGAGRQPAEGLRVLAEAVAAAYNIGERWYEAERHRLKGDLLLALSAGRVPDHCGELFCPQTGSNASNSTHVGGGTAMVSALFYYQLAL